MNKFTSEIHRIMTNKKFAFKIHNLTNKKLNSRNNSIGWYKSHLFKKKKKKKEENEAENGGDLWDITFPN